MDEDYLATLALYQLGCRVGDLMAADRARLPRVHGRTGRWGSDADRARRPGGQERVYRAGEQDREETVEDVRRFILEHTNVQGLKRGKHATWKGSEWCKVRM